MHHTRPAPKNQRFSTADATHAGSAYGPVFWAAYVANALVMVALAMLVRYADFVTYLGGAEGQLGLIVGVGMVGSLAMRLAQGIGIDRYGPRRIWLGSLLVFILSLVAHLGVHSATGPAVFILRILLQTSVAGIFGASITCISRRVPPARMAEIIGTLGSSGFIGILLGPLLGDWIFSEGPILRTQLDHMFACAAGLGCFSFFAAWAATRGEPSPMPRRRPNLFALLRRYNPGVVLLVAVAVGVGISVPFTFLRTYTAEVAISKIGLFFMTYAVTAFAVRMATRRLFYRYGNRPWVLCGLGAMAASVMLYLIVRQTWQLMIPGAAAGVAHALLFPAVVAGGSTRFPARYRGLGTTLILAMFDLGGLVGAPLIGGILYFARMGGLPAYPTMFTCVAAVLLTVACVFAVRTRVATGSARPAGDAERRPAAALQPAESSPGVAPSTVAEGKAAADGSHQRIVAMER